MAIRPLLVIFFFANYMNIFHKIEVMTQNQIFPLPFFSFFVCLIIFEPIKMQTCSAPQNDFLNHSFVKDMNVVGKKKCLERVRKLHRGQKSSDMVGTQIGKNAQKTLESIDNFRGPKKPTNIGRHRVEIIHSPHYDIFKKRNEWSFVGFSVSIWQIENPKCVTSAQRCSLQVVSPVDLLLWHQ